MSEFDNFCESNDIYSEYEKDIALTAWNYQKAIIDDLQNQLKLCREENKRLIKTLNDEKNWIDESNKSTILLGKVDVVLEGWKKDQINGLVKILRDENEK